MAKTIRQSIVEMLEQEELTTFDLAEKLAIKEKEVLGHLEHIIRSLRPKNQLVIEPAQCKSCGFQFKKRSRIKSPSRCPQCRSELIQRSRFFIK